MTTSSNNNGSASTENLAEWTDEAVALLELAKNAERTGVPADPRTKDRARDLLAKLDKASSGVDDRERPGSDERTLSENRILKARIAAIQEEAKRASQRLQA